MRFSDTVADGSRAAVLDVGCFSAHLLVVERCPSQRIASYKVRLRLDQVIDQSGRITTDGIELISDAVRTVERRLRTVRASTFLPFATSSVRDAANAAEVVDTVARRTGVTLRFLSGRAEADLAYRAVRHWCRPTGPLAVLDVGGGTVEIALGDGPRPEFACSLPLGARTLTRAGLTDERNLAEARALLHRRIEEAIPPEVATRLARARTAGCSKVFESLAKLTGTNPLRVEEVSAWVPRLAALPPHRRAELPGISPHRAGQALAGAVIAETLMRVTGHAAIDICPWSTREGVLLSLLEERGVS
ncbi:Ppx/GppA phosphatase family protein [Actinophytocola sp.]|uniref:Ppx/GppA phosphatase family protein n=1 Tax=Actinophytocola sp. TaxID=1872138 RepID=UPI00389B16DB